MGVGTRRLAELRGFSSTAYIRAAASTLQGGPTFTAQVLMRYLGASNATQHLAGNLQGTTGWVMRRLADTGAGTFVNFEFVVNEANVAQTLSVTNIESLYGKFVALTLRYDGDVLDAFINGVNVGTLATSGVPFTLSSGIFSIGYDLNAAVAPAEDEAFLGFAYTTAAVTTDAIVQNHLELIKRQEVTNGSITWTQLYNVARDAGMGVPATLRNNGSTFNALTVIGRSELTLGTPVAYLGDPTKQASGGGGGGDVSGPGLSTNNAIARWDGATGTQIKNSTVIVEDDGDVITTGALLLEDGVGDVSGFQAPANYTTPVVYTLPIADGVLNQVLTTDGGGALSWTFVDGEQTFAVFTATGQWTAPVDTTSASVWMLAGGGGGGAGAGGGGGFSGNGGGGGGGRSGGAGGSSGWGEASDVAITPTLIYDVTVGQGGAGGVGGGGGAAGTTGSVGGLGTNGTASRLSQGGIDILVYGGTNGGATTIVGGFAPATAASAGVGGSAGAGGAGGNAGSAAGSQVGLNALGSLGGLSGGNGGSAGNAGAAGAATALATVRGFFNSTTFVTGSGTPGVASIGAVNRGGGGGGGAGAGTGPSLEYNTFSAATAATGGGGGNGGAGGNGTAAGGNGVNGGNGTVGANATFGRAGGGGGGGGGGGAGDVGGTGGSGGNGGNGGNGLVVIVYRTRV